MQFAASRVTDQFDVTPGLHTQDLGYTFYDPAGAPFVPAAQETLQNAITSFVVRGIPALDHTGTQTFPRWGSHKTLVRAGEAQ